MLDPVSGGFILPPWLLNWQRIMMLRSGLCGVIGSDEKDGFLYF